MTEREIAEKTWELWNNYYKDGDLGSKEILDIIENDIKALTIPVVVGTLPCDECDDGKVWSPYYAKYVECDCRK